MKSKNNKETHLRNKVNRTNMNNNTLFDTEFANEYEFEDILSSDICPICGWEDTGFEENPDEQPSPYMMSFNDHKKWFLEKRKQNPKYKWNKE